MWRHPSTPMAPPMTVPSVQNAMVRTPLTVPAAANTPERSRGCSGSTLPSSKNVPRRKTGSRGSTDPPTASGAAALTDAGAGRVRTAARSRPERPSLHRRDLAEVELDELVGTTEIAIVVGDHDDGLPSPLEAGEQFLVEHLAEPWLLVGGPFVEQIDRPVFE